MSVTTASDMVITVGKTFSVVSGDGSNRRLGRCEVRGADMLTSRKICSKSVAINLCRDVRDVK